MKKTAFKRAERKMSRNLILILSAAVEITCALFLSVLSDDSPQYSKVADILMMILVFCCAIVTIRNHKKGVNDRKPILDTIEPIYSAALLVFTAYQWSAFTAIKRGYILRGEPLVTLKAFELRNALLLLAFTVCAVGLLLILPIAVFIRKHKRDE
ncbi:MAG: hypothetical protein LBN02_02590 [Oscillospiraceae bacterium]|jgi:hypothetical protein|nr:hypothetical protein [Oscillospiraceae bacterium]